jgi:hypothetical protein
VPSAFYLEAVVSNDRPHTEILEDFCGTAQLPTNAELVILLKAYGRKGAQAEKNCVDLKVAHDDTAFAWASICKDIVAMHNNGGGVLIFGIANDGARIGLRRSLSSHFDPSNLANKLQRYHVSGQVRSTYFEREYYRKLFGFLFIHTGATILVFDSDLQVPDSSKKSITIARAGTIYVRRGSASAPARQIEVDATLSALLGRGVRTFLARVEQVATLPSSMEIIAKQPGSAGGYILTSSGHGVPVTIVGPENGAEAVPLAEALLPDLPFSSVDAEVVGQLRQYRADSTHRVLASTLQRWYLERSNLNLPPGAARFLTLSALDQRGFPGYWASQMDPDNLREFLLEQVERNAYPARDAVPYLVAALFWDERQQILSGMTGHSLSDKVRQARDREAFLRRGRVGALVNVTVGHRHVKLDDLYDDRDQVQRLFDRILSDTQLLKERRQLAHQFDLWLHAVHEP